MNHTELLETPFAYSALVSRLAKPGQDLLRDSTAESLHIWHMATGLCTEVAELWAGVNAGDSQNILEELGDIEFYFEGLRQGVDPGPSTYFPHSIPERLREQSLEQAIYALSQACADALDLAKRFAVYAKPLDQDGMRAAMLKIAEALRVIYAYGPSREQVIAANQEKLSKRYPSGGYSNGQALARQDKKDMP